MITVKLMGGLGNQMFQYALGRNLAHALKTKLNLDIRIYDYDNNIETKWPFQLDLFKIDAQISKETPNTSLLARAIGKLTGDKKIAIKENGFRFDPAILNLPNGVTLDGYWQSEKYFRDIRDILLDEFTPVAAPSAENARIIKRMESELNSVSLHVRRGDYITSANANAFHGLAGLDYYKKALEDLSARIGKLKVYVFSDDPEWCKENLDTGHETVYVTNNTGDDSYWDMILMSKCRHHIIANSSFSWWGAWLGRNDDKIVYAPKRWFQNDAVDTSDVVPGGWIKL